MLFPIQGEQLTFVWMNSNLPNYLRCSSEYRTVCTKPHSIRSIGESSATVNDTHEEKILKVYRKPNSLRSLSQLCTQSEKADAFRRRKTCSICLCYLFIMSTTKKIAERCRDRVEAQPSNMSAGVSVCIESAVLVAQHF